MPYPPRPRRQRVRRFAGAESLEPRVLLTGAPVVHEFLASNATGIQDQDGEFQDWFEVYNPTTEPLEMTGWYATDDPQALTKWKFPEVSISPGDYMLVFASNKDRATAGRELHTNFKLAAAGESLLLVEPNGDTISGGFPAYPSQREDISYGLSQANVPLLPAGSNTQFRVPTADDEATGGSWTAVEFDDADWSSGPASLGFGVLESGFSVRQIDVQGGSLGVISNVSTALDLLSGNFPPDDYTIVADVMGEIGVLDFGGEDGAFSKSTNPYPHPNSTTDFTIEATATVAIPPGDWTIALGSDDGGLLRLDDVLFAGEMNTDGDAPGDDELRFESQRELGWTSGQFTVGPEGLTTNLTAVMFERNREDSFEVAIRAGLHDNLVNAEDWSLLQDGALGWSVLHPSQVAATDVRAAMQGVNASLWTRAEFEVGEPARFDSLQLQLRYNDGYVAYLNGQELVRDNAPSEVSWNSTATAARPASDSTRLASINVSQHLGKLQAGVNVLAVHGMNVTAADGDFLLDASLAASEASVVERYFLDPTPAGPNGEGVLGFVSDVVVSHQRGFYNEPITVELGTVTPDAIIRYTTDGSTPNESTGLQYATPLRIDATTMLRVAAFREGLDPSNTETHTYIFLSDVLQQSDVPPPTFPTRPVNGQTFNYGMDPQIVGSSTWGPQMIDALTALPSISVVTDSDNLFGASQGIYVNAGNRGAAWERPASIELIDPVAGGQFQINAGLRIRGGFSRSDSNPKHAFRVFFRDEYGAPKLNYPLFGDEGVDAFDNIDFRTAQNYSWSFQGDPRNTLLREVFSRDTQAAMGRPYTRSRHYHLYLNGQYWGVFMTQERAEASFAESYLGGAKDDFDVVKHSGSGVEATDGNLRAFRRLWSASRAGFADNEAYYRVQGMNADGTRNPNYERLLDAGSLIDYMTTAYFVGDRDGPGSRFTQPRPNNFYGIYNRESPDGFQWFMHDAEHSLGTGVSDLVNPLTIEHPGFNESNSNYFNPHWLHEKLVENAEYRRQFSDRVFELFQNDGALTVDNAIARVDARAAAIETAIVAESARWGDSKREPAYDKNTWLNAVEEVRDFIRTRHRVVLRQVQRRDWYPTIGETQFAVDGLLQHGGRIDPSAAITVSTSGVEQDEQVLLPTGQVWRYLDDGSNQGTAWREANFDDAAWSSGAAELGYGDGDEQTTVDFGGDGGDKFITTYFRHTFSLAQLAPLTNVTLSLKRDDGAIVYINGQEVLRSNMPDGSVDYLTRSAATVGGADESAFTEFSIPKSVLREGQNVVAVEIHQTSPTSSDISFDLELRAGTVGDLTGTVYLTTDGSDPREIGGGVSATAALYDGNAVQLTESAVLSARVWEDGNWGVLSQASFSIDAAATSRNLVISEVNYNPHPALPEFGEINTNDPDDFEFIELQNVGEDTVDLSGIRFTNGIAFEFAEQVIEPGEWIVIPRNKAAFASRYGDGIPLAVGHDGDGNVGVYGGKLSNGGETLRLEDPDGQVIQELRFDDDPPWATLADGDGSSLELIDVSAPANDAYNWRASGKIGGSPGTAGGAFPHAVVINEILTHTDDPVVDTVELRNTTSTPIDVSGWYVSDAGSDLRKYQISDGVVIAGGGYLVLTESQLGYGFRGQEADNAYLVQPDADGRPTWFSDYVEFGATQNGVTLGRWPEATIGALFPMVTPTLGDENAGPDLADVFISELRYQPAPGASPADLREFVEITNRGPARLNIGDWQLAGAVDYTFPPALEIGPGESFVVVAFDPAADPAAAAAWRADLSLPDDFRLWGPYSDADRPNSDSLRDAGETLILQRPEDPDQLGLGYVLVDRVTYDDALPWPQANGNGSSLQRKTRVAYGDLPQNWFAATPSPGIFVDGIPGDLNADRLVDEVDIDMLVLAIRTGQTDAAFDLDGSGSIDDEDLDLLVTGLLKTRQGDADLNGQVDFQDFLRLAAHFGEDQQGWADGNFDTDPSAEVDFSDFVILAANFGFARAAHG